MLRWSAIECDIAEGVASIVTRTSTKVNLIMRLREICSTKIACGVGRKSTNDEEDFIMKNSELYKLAMLAVIDSNMAASTKLNVLEMLIGDKQMAEYREEREEKEN